MKFFAELSVQFFEPVLAASGTDNLIAAANELASSSFAETGGCAGNENDHLLSIDIRLSKTELQGELDNAWAAEGCDLAKGAARDTGGSGSGAEQHPVSVV